MKPRASKKFRTTLFKNVDGRRVAFNPLVAECFDPSDWLDHFQERRKLKTADKNRKNSKVIDGLRQQGKNIRSTILSQLKCLMSVHTIKQKFFIRKAIIKQAITKIKANERSQIQYNISLQPFLVLADKIFNKYADSEVILKNYEFCMKSQIYPPTVQFMLIYLGAFLYSVNGNYQQSEIYCRKFFDLIVRLKVEEYFIIYLMMQIRMKTSLNEWGKAVNYLTKLIFFSWLYNLDDLQIWCYFQFSRAFFFLQEKNKSESFRHKSEMNYLQAKDSIYRDLCISKLKHQIQQIWEGQIEFCYEDVLDETRLALPQKEKFDCISFVKDQRKLQSSIKKIISECKIKHVTHLLTRISQTNQFMAESTNPDPFSPKKQMGGNNFLLTHRSRNKNMKMYFRAREKKPRLSKDGYYTIENSQKNWYVLKEMLKSIQAEIDSVCCYDS